MKKLISLLLFLVIFVSLSAQCPFVYADMCPNCEGDYFYIVEDAVDNDNVVVIETAPNYYILTAHEPTVFIVDVYFENGNALEYAYMCAVSVNENNKSLMLRYFDFDKNGKKILVTFTLSKVCGVKITVI